MIGRIAQLLLQVRINTTVWMGCPLSRPGKTTILACAGGSTTQFKRPVFSRSRGGIGRRVRLRTVWGNPWRFESSREHHSSLSGEIDGIVEYFVDKII